MIREVWRAPPILGIRQVRRAEECYRDVLDFRLDPDDGVFQPTAAAAAGGAYAIVQWGGVWIHFQVRRGGSAGAETAAQQVHPHHL